MSGRTFKELGRLDLNEYHFEENETLQSLAIRKLKKEAKD